LRRRCGFRNPDLKIPDPIIYLGRVFLNKKSRLAGRVKEGRKGLPLPATGDEKGAFALYVAMGVPTFKINDNLLILKVY
jgi:hypothetical protein